MSAERQESIRAVSVVRVALFGAVGFGIGGAITLALPLTVLIAGAVGGASLGLALKDFRRIPILALSGAAGLILGLPVGLSLGSFFNYSEVAIAAIVGAVVGALLGLTFGDWRTILALSVAGAVGFGIGLLTGDFLRASFPILRQAGETGSITVAGLVGGASLGAGPSVGPPALTRLRLQLFIEGSPSKIPSGYGVLWKG